MRCRTSCLVASDDAWPSPCAGDGHALLQCDEIASALDPELVGDLPRVVELFAAEGMTLPMVAHEMRFARKVLDRVIFMRHGRVHEMGPTAEPFGNAQTPELPQFLSSPRD